MSAWGRDLLERAEAFLCAYHEEEGLSGLSDRLAAVREEIRRTGSYVQTQAELTHGARVAWRNSNRCIGRLFWKSLMVLDRRQVDTASAVVAALEEHLALATNGGRIRPMISIFPPQSSEGGAPVRIWNKQLIRYAGYRREDGSVLGDPAQLAFTEECRKRAWRGAGSPFDVLPWLVSVDGADPVVHPVPADLVLEVPLAHPEHPWFAELGWRWHAVPVISDMVLEIGGILYPAAPFNGWYMVTEIGARNLGDPDRYNLLPVVARAMGWDRSARSVFWKDRALVLLNEAVAHSFRAAGVQLTDHHEASEQFLRFVRNETTLGRKVMADWAWIVPPMAGSTMAVFHQHFDNEVRTPNYFHNRDPWAPKDPASACPFHVGSLGRSV